MKKTEDTKSKKFSKINLFKRIKISIIDFDKYYQISAEGIGKSILYLSKLILIFAVIVSACILYKMPEIMENNEVAKQILTILSENSNGYITLFIYTFIILFITYFITVIIEAFALSLLGIITCKTVKLQLGYSSIFAISASALTLPIILNLLYVLANLLFKFEMDQFQIMSTLISYIYLIVSILSFKANILKIEREEGEA